MSSKLVFKYLAHKGKSEASIRNECYRLGELRRGKQFSKEGESTQVKENSKSDEVIEKKRVVHQIERVTVFLLILDYNSLT